jgi:hypothetical protein
LVKRRKREREREREREAVYMCNDGRDPDLEIKQEVLVSPLSLIPGPQFPHIQNQRSTLFRFYHSFVLKVMLFLDNIQKMDI